VRDKLLLLLLDELDDYIYNSILVDSLDNN